MNLPLDRKISRDFAGAGAGGGLACAVEISESVKRIVALAAHINKIGVNAILLAHRAGDLARGFGVLSNELRAYTRQVTTSMKCLSEVSFCIVGEVSALLRKAHNLRLIEKTQQELRVLGKESLLDPVLERASQECLDRTHQLGRLHRELGSAVEEAQNLGQLGSVLASAARIEVAYAGVFSAELKDVTVEFGSAIEQIVAAVEQVKAAARAQGVRR